MSRLNDIETALYSVLKGIDGTMQPTGYQYYTHTGQVNVINNALATDRNFDSRDINHYFLLDSEDNITWDLGQNQYENNALYTIRSHIALNGSEGNVQESAKRICNNVQSDIKHALGAHYTLGGECSWVRYLSSIVEYSTNGSVVTSATLVSTIEIRYTQQISNPNIQAC